MADKTKLAAVIPLALLLASCATGNELKGTWTLTVGRDGTCRSIEHQASTDQLSTSTRWRGEGCVAAEPIDQDDAATLELEVPHE